MSGSFAVLGRFGGSDSLPRGGNGPLIGRDDVLSLPLGLVAQSLQKGSAQDRAREQFLCIFGGDATVPGSVRFDGDHRSVTALGETAGFHDPDLIREPCCGYRFTERFTGLQRSLSRTSATVDTHQHDFFIGATDETSSDDHELSRRRSMMDR